METGRDLSAKRGRWRMDMGTVQTCSRPAWIWGEVWGIYRKVKLEHSFESMGMAWFWSFG